MNRESNHQDHVSVFSFKTLTTLCTRAGFEEWRLIPYHAQYIEMALRAKGSRRTLVQMAQTLVVLSSSSAIEHADGGRLRAA
jgi:hypothetical protein